jgi:hypothetical protein
MLQSAIRRGWPLLTVLPRNAALEPADVIRYLRTGGTIFIPNLGAEDNDWLRTLGAALEITMPRCRPLRKPASRITFSGQRPDINAEFAGISIDNTEGTCFLDGGAGSETLAWLQAGEDAARAVIEVPSHGGRLILAVGPPPRPGNLYELFQPESALSVLPAMMLVRAIFGDAAWHSPFPMANFTIDDPMLREGFLGFDYRGAIAAAQEQDIHLSVATVPRELALADRETVALLADNRDWISACYHGNDHDGYEFFVSDNGHSRFGSRTLTSQRAALRQAADRGIAFAGRTGYALDRVMVFPHGVGPAAILPELGSLGFLATTNWLDRYPLASPLPDSPDLGMRPADMAWNGFPLIWRRPLDDETFAFDLFIGRPVIYFMHRRQTGINFEPLRDLASQVNGVAVGKVQWLSLENIARHAYVQRRVMGGNRWEILMTANVACLHNTDRDTRHYRVYRPHLAEGTLLVGPAITHGCAEICVEVPPGQTAVVKALWPDERELPDPLAGRPCSLGDSAAC